MTHEDQTTPASVDVTQADRDRAEAFWQEYGPFRMGTVSALSAAFARHRMDHSAPAGEVVPVAWLVRHEMHGTEVTTLKCTEADKAYGWTETPLYTHPAPPADVVELVEALEIMSTAFAGYADTDAKREAVAIADAALAKHGGA